MVHNDLDDRETLLRFLNPRGNHIAENDDGTKRVASIAFLCKNALKDATDGVSVFVASASNLTTLRGHFNHDGLAHVTIGNVLTCGFSLIHDVSKELPNELHLLIRPQVDWSWKYYRAKGAELAELAVIMYPPAAQ